MSRERSEHSCRAPQANFSRAKRALLLGAAGYAIPRAERARFSGRHRQCLHERSKYSCKAPQPNFCRAERASSLCISGCAPASEGSTLASRRRTDFALRSAGRARETDAASSFFLCRTLPLSVLDRGENSELGCLHARASPFDAGVQTPCAKRESGPRRLLRGVKMLSCKVKRRHGESRYPSHAFEGQRVLHPISCAWSVRQHAIKTTARRVRQRPNAAPDLAPTACHHRPLADIRAPPHLLAQHG